MDKVAEIEPGRIIEQIISRLNLLGMHNSIISYNTFAIKYITSDDLGAESKVVNSRGSIISYPSEYLVVILENFVIISRKLTSVQSKLKLEALYIIDECKNVIGIVTDTLDCKSDAEIFAYSLYSNIPVSIKYGAHDRVGSGYSSDVILLSDNKASMVLNKHGKAVKLPYKPHIDIDFGNIKVRKNLGIRKADGESSDDTNKYFLVYKEMVTGAPLPQTMYDYYVATIDINLSLDVEPKYKGMRWKV